MYIHGLMRAFFSGSREMQGWQKANLFLLTQISLPQGQNKNLNFKFVEEVSALTSFLETAVLITDLLLASYRAGF